MAKGFADALLRHSREVAALEGDQATKMLELLRELRDRLTARSVDVADSTVNAFVVARLESETKAAIATLEMKAAGVYDAAAKQAVEMAIDHLGDEVGRLSLAFDGRMLEVALSPAAAIADPSQALLANHFASSASRYGADLLNRVRQRLFIGLRTGAPPGPLMRDIAGDRGPMGRIGREGAERLMRTETSNSYGAAVHDGIAQAAKKVPGLKKVWLHLSSYICDVCIPLNGTERPLNGTWTIRQGKQTRKVSHPPAHPNCACRVTAMKGSWRNGLQKLGYLSKDEE